MGVNHSHKAVQMGHVLANVITSMPGIRGAYRTEIRYCPRCGTLFREDFDEKQLKEDAVRWVMLVGREGWVRDFHTEAQLLVKNCRSIPSDCDLNLRSEVFTQDYLKLWMSR